MESGDSDRDRGCRRPYLRLADLSLVAHLRFDGRRLRDVSGFSGTTGAGATAHPHPGCRDRSLHFRGRRRNLSDCLAQDRPDRADPRPGRGSASPSSRCHNFSTTVSGSGLRFHALPHRCRTVLWVRAPHFWHRLSCLAAPCSSPACCCWRHITFGPIVACCCRSGRAAGHKTREAVASMTARPAYRSRRLLIDVRRNDMVPEAYNGNEHWTSPSVGSRSSAFINALTYFGTTCSIIWMVRTSWPIGTTYRNRQMSVPSEQTSRI